MDGSRDPMTPVLDTVPPPSLHIKPGIVNKHNPELKITFPDIYQWPAGLYIQKEDYHSRTLEGNQCNTGGTLHCGRDSTQTCKSVSVHRGYCGFSKDIAPD